MMDDRAVSTAISYVLVVSLALVLTTGLVLGTESLIENQREDTVRQQLEVVGQQLAGTAMTVDRFNETEAVPENASVTRQFPGRVAGSQYQVGVLADDPDSGRYTIYLDAVDIGVNVTVPVRQVDSGLRTVRVNGGTLEIEYVHASKEVVIRHA